MNELQIFNNPKFGDVRTIKENGQVLFCGSDVAKALGYARPNDAIAQHCRSTVKRRIGVQTGTKADGTPAIQEVEMTFIPEGDIYRLAARSKLPGADEFERWIFDEVLPSIRKNGAYMTPETLQAAISNPDYLLQVVTALKNETDKRKALEITNASLAVDLEIARPKAEYFDELAARNTLTNFRETAKELGVGPKKFTEFLLRHKYIYRDDRGKLMPYERKNTGYFEVKECFNEKTQWSGTQTLITPKGREAFRMMRIDAE